ncbi:MAG: hypothetical protein COW13_00975 [Candidatus Omnitrophica bacterium CG12_big_fil_rev_8_21_14_0_65_50_5]|nr:MAG: hypothetical protein COW13_00975 [Candidatus Omnitrophica bacterium CG12_big_fil_rev_8_21_14_0_65_50_5]
MKTIFLIVVSGLVLSSCSFYNIKSQQDSSEAVATQQKKSFMDIEYAPEVTRSYQVIGTLRVKTERNRDWDDVIRKMKMEAAVMGGDAVTDIILDPEMRKDKNANKKLRVDYIGQVIVYQP